MPKHIAKLVLISASVCIGLSQIRVGRGRPAPQQIVFMIPVGGAIVPGPGAIYEIAVVNLDGSGFRQLTHDGTFKFLPHFSPDGTKIVYTKYSVGQYGSPNAVTDLAIYDLGAGTESVITHEGSNVQGTWAPTGKRIAYLNVGPPVTIWTIDPDGSNPQKVASSSGAIDDLQWGDIAWSPDDWILFSVAQN